MQKDITLAQKMKHIADAANCPEPDKFPTELYRYILKEIEKSAKNGEYRCYLDFRKAKPTEGIIYDPNEYAKYSRKLVNDLVIVSEKLRKDGFIVESVNNNSFDIFGSCEFIKIYWEN